MSSHCYKLFDLFSSIFPIKPLFGNRGRYIVVTKSVGRMLCHCHKILFLVHSNTYLTNALFLITIFFYFSYQSSIKNILDFLVHLQIVL